MIFDMLCQEYRWVRISVRVDDSLLRAVSNTLPRGWGMSAVALDEPASSNLVSCRYCQSEDKSL